MIELRKALHTKLKLIHSDVNFQTASDTSQFPYLVYDCQVYDDGEGAQRVTLDIDGWDNEKDTTALEELMKKVNEGINKAVLTTDKISVVFYLEKKIPLIDERVKNKRKEEIMRRKFTYSGKLFERGD